MNILNYKSRFFIFSVILIFVMGFSNINIYASSKIEISDSPKNEEITAKPISFLFEEKLIDKSVQDLIYLSNQRYYLPIEYFINQLGGTMTIENNVNVKINIKDQNYILTLGSKIAKKNNQDISLVEPLLSRNNVVYANLTDLTRIFNFVCNFDYTNTTIKIFKNRQLVKTKSVVPTGKTSFLRLEDLSFNGIVSLSSENKLKKIRVLSDMLYEKSIPFHIAWIPRFVDPKYKIDNDLLVNSNFANVDYVFTLDYMIFKGGMLGLHGYTHQNGNEKSASGSDFSEKINNTTELANSQIEKAKNTANFLKLPYGFFEFPHYIATNTQLKVAESHFKYIYQPYDVKNYRNIKKINNVKYIPTPLDYVDGKEKIDDFLLSSKKLLSSKNNLGSFFFHPHIEYDFISFKTDSTGYVSYDYSEESPLNKIIKLFNSLGYSFYYINQ